MIIMIIIIISSSSSRSIVIVIVMVIVITLWFEPAPHKCGSPARTNNIYMFHLQVDELQT